MNIPESRKICAAATPDWSFRDVPGAGIEIYAVAGAMEMVDLPIKTPVIVIGLTAPREIQIAFERWVQFEHKGWHEMQMANAAFAVHARTALPLAQSKLQRQPDETA